jgi:hypothetical protein
MKRKKKKQKMRKRMKRRTRKQRLELYQRKVWLKVGKMKGTSEGSARRHRAFSNPHLHTNRKKTEKESEEKREKGSRR